VYQVGFHYTDVRKKLKFNNFPTKCDCIQFVIFLLAALPVSGVDSHHQELV